MLKNIMVYDDEESFEDRNMYTIQFPYHPLSDIRKYLKYLTLIQDYLQFDPMNVLSIQLFFI